VDRCTSWIGGIGKLKELNEFAAAMTIPHERVNLIKSMPASKLTVPRRLYS
jgi:hypothetical protein